MLCHCGTQLNNQAPVYRYCPHCGSPTGHLARVDGGNNVTQGLAVHEGQFSTHTLISFRNEGLNSITLRSALTLPDGSSPEWASLNAVNAQVQPGQTFHLTATFAPASREAWERAGRLPLALRVVHNDAMRRDPWDAESCRAEMTFTVPLSFIEPAQLEAHEELLIFSERAMERTLTLVNLGGQDARIDHFGYSPDFEISAATGTPAPAYVPLGWTLKPDALLRVRVRARALPRTVERTPLTIVTDGGSRRIVVTLLRRPAPQPILKPAFLVGVDMGTHEATIALRDCETDAIELLHAPHENTNPHLSTLHPFLPSLKQLVDDTIQAKTDGADVDVRTIFCVPHPQQRDALLPVTQAQGFSVTPDDFWLRPVCSALHFFIGERRGLFRVNDGQWLAVCAVQEDGEDLTLLSADLTPEGDLTLNVSVQCPVSHVQSLTDIPPLREFAHVFVIGDVLRAPAVREQLCRIFPERIVHNLSAEDVTESVARGAVWVMDTYVGVVAPYRITLRDDAGYPPVDLVQPGVTLPGRARRRTYVVTPQRWAELELVADVEGQPHRLCRLWLPRGENENVEYKLRFDHPRPGFLRITRMNGEEDEVMWEGVIA
jgi:hypothetical protein